MITNIILISFLLLNMIIIMLLLCSIDIVLKNLIIRNIKNLKITSITTMDNRDSSIKLS